MSDVHPTVRHLVLCEDVQTDPDNPLRVSLVGLASAIRSLRTRTIPLPTSPLEVVGVTFRIRNCLYPEPGLYLVQFWYNEQVIAEQPLLLR